MNDETRMVSNEEAALEDAVLRAVEQPNFPIPIDFVVGPDDAPVRLSLSVRWPGGDDQSNIDQLFLQYTGGNVAISDAMYYYAYGRAIIDTLAVPHFGGGYPEWLGVPGPGSEIGIVPTTGKRGLIPKSKNIRSRAVITRFAEAYLRVYERFQHLFI